MSKPDRYSSPVSMDPSNGHGLHFELPGKTIWCNCITHTAAQEIADHINGLLRQSALDALEEAARIAERGLDPVTQEEIRAKAASLRQDAGKGGV